MNPAGIHVFIKTTLIMFMVDKHVYSRTQGVSWNRVDMSSYIYAEK